MADGSQRAFPFPRTPASRAIPEANLDPAMLPVAVAA